LFQHLLPSIESKLRGHGKPYILSANAKTGSLTLADLALYHELVQVLSIIGMTEAMFSVDTSSTPVLIVKNVDISTYPKVNNWMYKMQSEVGSSKAISMLEKEMSKLRERTVK